MDLAAITKYLGRFLEDGQTPAWTNIKGFDLDGTGFVDLVDIVIVAKNICRTEPDKIHPFPLPEP